MQSRRRAFRKTCHAARRAKRIEPPPRAQRRIGRGGRTNTRTGRRRSRAPFNRAAATGSRWMRRGRAHQNGTHLHNLNKRSSRTTFPFPLSAAAPELSRLFSRYKRFCACFSRGERRLRPTYIRALTPSRRRSAPSGAHPARLCRKSHLECAAGLDPAGLQRSPSFICIKDVARGGRERPGRAVELARP